MMSLEADPEQTLNDALLMLLRNATDGAIQTLRGPDSLTIDSAPDQA